MFSPSKEIHRPFVFWIGDLRSKLSGLIKYFFLMISAIFFCQSLAILGFQQEFSNIFFALTYRSPS